LLMMAGYARCAWLWVKGENAARTLAADSCHS